MHVEEGGGMHSSSGTQKSNDDSRASRGVTPQTRGSRFKKNQVAYKFPPPVDSPPFIASSRYEEGGEGEKNRRRSRSATPPRPRGGRRGGFGLAYDRQQGGHCGDSSSSRSSSSCGSHSSRSRSSSNSSRRSSSRSGLRGDDRDGHYIGGSSSTSGDEGKTYLANDLVSAENDGESGDGGKGGVRSGSSIDGKRGIYNHRDGQHCSLGLSECAGRIGRPSRDSAAAYPLEKEYHHNRPCCSHPKNRSRKKGASTGRWAEGSPAKNIIASNNDEEDDNGDNGDNDESPGSYVCRRNSSRRSIKRGEKARGSETTATPSPREYPSGFGRSPVSGTSVSGGNEGVVGGPAISAETDAMAYGTGGGGSSGGDGGSGLNSSRQRHSTTSSSSTLRAFRQESTLPSPDFGGEVHDDDRGLQIDDSASKGNRKRDGGRSSHGGGDSVNLSENDQKSSSRRRESLRAMRSHHSEEKKKTSGSASNADAR